MKLNKQADPACRSDMDNIERTISLPVLNPGSTGQSRSFVFMGVVDRVENGKVIDWKGVGRVNRALTQLAIGFQGELYALAMQHSGTPIHEIEYRLITRPLLQYTEPSYKYAVMREGRKTALRVSEDRNEACDFARETARTGPPLGEERNVHNVPSAKISVEERVTGYRTRQAYEDRCLEWLLEVPYRMLNHPYLLTPAKLEQARWLLWECSKRILDSRQNNRWIPNARACYSYEQECPYRALCVAVQGGDNYESLIDEQYHGVTSSHPELGEVDEPPERILTHTSLTDLTSCEFFYLWCHERRLRKSAQEDSEPLWVGSAVHRGLAEYARALKQSADSVPFWRAFELGFDAIDKWAQQNPVLGQDAFRRQEAQVARARAMVRAANLKWPEPKGKPDAST